MPTRLKHGRILSGREVSTKTTKPRIDFWLLAVILLLSGFGLLMVFDVSVVVATAQYGDEFYYVKQQAFNLGIGLVALLIASRLDYHFWQKLAPLMLFGGFALLLAVFIPGLGKSVLGANRWIDIGFTTLQPAYLMCFILIVYLASWFSSDNPQRQTFQGGILPFGVLMAVILAIVAILQKDLGSASIIILTGVAMYFLSGAPLRYLGLIVPAGAVAGGLLILLEPYRIKRVFTFLDNTQDTQGAAYHINQIMIALGSGGWVGVGLGHSRQKYQYIPEVQTDSIFAVIGEELGFLGVVLLIGVFSYMLWRGFSVARRAPDNFGRLLAGGIMSLITIQAFINLFAMVSIIPLTGIPLPLISYGGTSLIVLLGSLGVVLNVSRQIPGREAV